MSGKRRKPLARITAIWDRDSKSVYPETLKVPMEGGMVVTYRLDIEQPHPSFLLAMENIKNLPDGSYPNEKRRSL